MEKVDILSLVMGFVFGIAAVIISFYGDTVGVVMMAASGITLLLIYLYRIACSHDYYWDIDNSAAFLPFAL